MQFLLSCDNTIKDPPCSAIKTWCLSLNLSPPVYKFTQNLDSFMTRAQRSWTWCRVNWILWPQISLMQPIFKGSCTYVTLLRCCTGGVINRSWAWVIERSRPPACMQVQYISSQLESILHSWDNALGWCLFQAR